MRRRAGCGGLGGGGRAGDGRNLPNKTEGGTYLVIGCGSSSNDGGGSSAVSVGVAAVREGGRGEHHQLG